MKIVYNCIVFFASLLLPVVAIFNKKIKLFVDGRKQTFSKIATLKNSKTIWFHAASLGEFEQAIPLIEVLKVTHAEYKILVTFFSPQDTKFVSTLSWQMSFVIYRLTVAQMQSCLLKL